MNRIILTKTIVLTEFVFHLKNISAVCTDDTHKNGRLFRGGVAYIYRLNTSGDVMSVHVIPDGDEF